MEMLHLEFRLCNSVSMRNNFGPVIVLKAKTLEDFAPNVVHAIKRTYKYG